MRALAGLTLAVVLRLLREGLVVRALAWPGVLTGLTLFVVAGFIAVQGREWTVVVEDSTCNAELEAAGLRVRQDENPENWLLDGGALLAVWRENDGWILGHVFESIALQKAHSALRDCLHDAWRFEMLEFERAEADLDRAVAAMLGLLAVLFALYGAVIGAGVLFRDRTSGALEAELALPLPTWMHAAARLLALVAVLVPAAFVSMAIIDALLSAVPIGAWLGAIAAAAITSGALGLTFVAHARMERGFSGALSRTLIVTAGLVALGYSLPAVGAYLPVSSIGAGMVGVTPSPVALLGAAALAALAVADFGRCEIV